MLLAAGPHPTADSLLARRLYLAARDQEALLRYDSALTLYRAARRTAPSYLPAQLGYIDLMRRRLQLAELQREYQVRPGQTDPVARCLALATTWLASRGDSVAVPLSLERLIPASPCALYVLGGGFQFSNAAELRHGRRAELGMPERAVLWITYSRILDGAGRWPEARTNLEEGIRRAAHPLDSVVMMNHLVAMTLQHGDTAGAVALDRALQRAARRDGRPGVLLRGVSFALEPNRDPSGARLRIARAARCGLEEWQSLQELTHEVTDRGEPGRALGFADRAIEIADSAGLPSLAVISYTQRGRAYLKSGRLDDAVRDLGHAVSVGARVRPVVYLADAWHNLAHAHEGLGRYDRASDAADRYMVLAESISGSARLTSLQDAGLIRWKAGRRTDSRVAYEAAIRWVDAHRTERYWAGEYLERIGDLSRALAYYHAGAAENKQEVTNLRGQFRVFESLGYLDSSEAAARAHDAIDWDVPNEVPLMPRVLARLGRLDSAVRISGAWAARQQAGSNVEGETLARLELAELLLRGRPGLAVAEAARAESLAMRLSLTASLVEACRLKGVALLRAGDRAAGLSALERAADLARSHPTAPAIVATRTALGDALAVSSPSAALASYEIAAASVENLTGRLEEDLDRVGYRESHMAAFDGAMRTLLREPPTTARLEALLRWSGRRKGAALALSMQSDEARPTVRTVGVRDVRARLGPREALVDFIVLEDAVAAVVITGSQAEVVSLPVTRDLLTHLVDRLRRPLTMTFGRRLDLARAPFDLELAHTLYESILAPLAKVLEGADHLLIVPDGPLHYLPFEALVVQASPATDYRSAHYAVDDFAIEYLPSVESVRFEHQRSRSLATGRLLAVVRGVEGGAREFDAIRTTWGAQRVRALQEDAGTETAVRADMTRFSILHFAVHATADDRDPLASHLALAPDSLADGLFRMNEIAAQRTPARLVVLSACETQAGRNFGGEGVMSLARGFLMAGAEAVVATRWPVGPSTADVMSGFYRELARGVPPATALRSARLGLRRDPRTAHPFYWAGFVLIRG